MIFTLLNSLLKLALWLFSNTLWGSTLHDMNEWMMMMMMMMMMLLKCSVTMTIFWGLVSHHLC